MKSSLRLGCGLVSLAGVVLGCSLERPVVHLTAKPTDGENSQENEDQREPPGNRTETPGDDGANPETGAGEMASSKSVGVNSTWLWVADGQNYLGPNRTLEGVRDGTAYNSKYIEKLSKMRSIRLMDLMNANFSHVKSWDMRAKVTDNWLDPKFWGFGNSLDQPNSGAPIEWLVGLCNHAKVDCWFTLPVQADDDYVRNFAKYVKDNLHPALIARIEIGNETWNGGFDSAQYAQKKGNELFGSGFKAHEWTGMRLAQVCDILKKEVFKGQEQRIRCVAATQVGNTGVLEGILECPGWTKMGNEPCWKHGFDEVAVAPYFSYRGDWGPYISRGDAALDEMLDLLIEAAIKETRDTCAGDLKIAQRYNLTFISYEGGLDLGWRSEGATKEFYRKVSRHPKMKDAYRTMLQTFKDMGGTLYHQYVDIRPPGEGAFYGALEHIDDDTPRWQALVEFSTGVPCWWSGCERK